jgi:H+-transporting ATPase
MWNSRPSLVMMAFSFADIVLVSTLAILGILMEPLSPGVVVALLGASLIFALLLDQLKVVLFRHLPVD